MIILDSWEKCCTHCQDFDSGPCTTAHGENILVWDDVLYGFFLGVESSYSLVIARAKQCTYDMLAFIRREDKEEICKAPKRFDFIDV